MRFHPLVLKVRALIQSGAIGSVRLLTADFGYPLALRTGDWRLNPALGGGALLDCGVYPISLAFFLLGRPEGAVGRAAIGQTGVDELMSATFTYADGALAIATASLRSRLRNEALIIGSKGQIRIHEPFYAPHRATITHCDEPTTLEVTHTSVSHHTRLARLKRNPLIRRAFDQVGRPVLSLLRRDASEMVSYAPGTGYQYEAAEVMRCLREASARAPSCLSTKPRRSSKRLTLSADHGSPSIHPADNCSAARRNLSDLVGKRMVIALCSQPTARNFRKR